MSTAPVPLETLLAHREWVRAVVDVTETITLHGEIEVPAADAPDRFDVLLR